MKNQGNFLSSTISTGRVFVIFHTKFNQVRQYVTNVKDVNSGRLIRYPFVKLSLSLLENPILFVHLWLI